MFNSKVFAVTAALVGSAMLVPGQSTYSGRDQNNDGIISLNEWSGNRRDFRSYDTNRDGVLSGTEVPEHYRSTAPIRGQGSRSREATARLDKNNSGVVEGYEWPYNSQVFHQLDKDGDSVLSDNELRNLSSVTVEQLDKNRNQRIDADEWPGSFAQFDKLDKDGNGKISSAEFFDRGGEYQRRSRFDAWDRDRNGQITSSEWQSTPRLFRMLDANRDSVLSWDEFMKNEERYNEPFGWRQ